MEGLIPLLCKAIKRKKIRSQYRCLSMGSTQTYHIADFYDYHDHHDHDHHHDDDGKFGKYYNNPSMETRGGFRGGSNGHRRFASTGEFEMNGGYNFNYGGCDHEDVARVSNYSPPKHIIKRYGSHRMFSCITGGV